MSANHGRGLKKGGRVHAEQIYRYVQRKGLASPESVPERYRIVVKKQIATLNKVEEIRA